MIEWPDNLPLPMIAAQGAPQPATIVSDENFGPQLRRARFKFSTFKISVSWTLSIGENDAFETFFNDTLNSGAAQFQIGLRYPKQSELMTWNARFTADYSSQYGDGCWMVQALLELSPVSDDEFAPLAGETVFYVKQQDFPVDETMDVPFNTSDDFSFNVKT